MLIFHVLKDGDETTGYSGGRVREKERISTDNDSKFIYLFMFSNRFISGRIQGLSQVQEYTQDWKLEIYIYIFF